MAFYPITAGLSVEANACLMHDSELSDDRSPITVMGEKEDPKR